MKFSEKVTAFIIILGILSYIVLSMLGDQFGITRDNNK